MELENMKIEVFVDGEKALNKFAIIDALKIELGIFYQLLKYELFPQQTIKIGNQSFWKISLLENAIKDVKIEKYIKKIRIYKK